MPNNLNTRFPNGVTNSSDIAFFADMGQLDPTKFHTYFDDFDYFTAGDWTITTTEAGAGDATEALADGDGGLLKITTDAANNDNDFLQKKGESFKFVAGKRLWFKSRFRVSDASASDVVMGLQITDTTPLDVTDGVFFLKADGANTVDFIVEKNNTATTTSAVATLGDDAFVTLGFYYDGASTIQIWVDDAVVATSVTTNLVDDEELTISFGLQNGDAVPTSLTIDYILACKER